MKIFHESVLLTEAIEGLNIKEGGIYVDVTYGGGGHTRKILEEIGQEGKLYAFDQDKDAINNKINDNRLIMIHQNFKYLSNFLEYEKEFKIDGLIADLGVSSFQIDTKERGFSFMKEAALDMRMDVEATISAYNVINEYNANQLAFLFGKYGELKNAKIIANTIIKNRRKNKIRTTTQLVNLLKSLTPERSFNKFFAKLFQAIRIVVNSELTVLESLLKQALKLLSDKGRIVIISYHSLEDRMVKNFFRTGNVIGNLEEDFYGNKKDPFQLITKKPIRPTQNEITNNPRARSAKMRIAEKK